MVDHRALLGSGEIVVTKEPPIKPPTPTKLGDDFFQALDGEADAMEGMEQ